MAGELYEYANGACLRPVEAYELKRCTRNGWVRGQGATARQCCCVDRDARSGNKAPRRIDGSASQMPSNVAVDGDGEGTAFSAVKPVSSSSNFVGFDSARMYSLASGGLTKIARSGLGTALQASHSTGQPFKSCARQRPVLCDCSARFV